MRWPPALCCCGSVVEQQAGANAARSGGGGGLGAEAEQNYKRRRPGRCAYVSKAQIDQALRRSRFAVAADACPRAQVAQAAQQAITRGARRSPGSWRRARSSWRDLRPGQPLMRVHARVNCASRCWCRRAAPRRSAAIRGPLGAAATVARVVPAEVVVFPAADPASHSVNVRVRLPDPRPAARARELTAKWCSMPTSALSTAGPRCPCASPRPRSPSAANQSGVYVSRMRGRIVLRQLRLGATCRRQRRGDGLRPGDRAVRDPVAAVAGAGRAAQGGGRRA